MILSLLLILAKLYMNLVRKFLNYGHAQFKILKKNRSDNVADILLEATSHALGGLEHNPG